MTADRHPWIELAPGISRLRALAAAHATGGRPVRAESATEREKQLPGASVSDRRDRFIRHPQVMAQATPCIRRKT